jgi:anti-sigma28 factor (negative regulator of flagellin synthesis)
MAEKNGNGTEAKRKSFRKDEGIQAWKLCSKSAIRIDTLKADLKEEQERFEKLKDAIRNGGYLVEDQGHLPLEVDSEGDALRT